MKKITTIIICFIAFSTQAQRQLRKADKLFEDMAYVEAAKMYEDYFQNNNEEPESETIRNIADSYYYIGNSRNALKWYDKLYQIMGSNISDKYYLRYIQSLRGVRDYNIAEEQTKLYYKRKNDPKIIERYVNQKNRLDSLANIEPLYTIRNLAINTENSDFGGAFYGAQLIFSASRDSSAFNTKYSWNQQPFLNFYVADRNGSNGMLSNPKLFMPEIESKYHDATISFSKNLDTVYYTTNIQKKKNRLLNTTQGTNNFQIIRGIIKEGKLINAEPVFFDNNDYSVGHPSLSKDGKWLFFVSDMPGGYGDTDIYVVQVFSDGSMNSPKNLGPTINTEGREMFPFYKDSTLYFSSDGHYGLGGLDIFSSTNKGDLTFTDPKNLGKPINSNKDDFSFIIDSTDSKGYFSSNRLSGKGDDDIYYFTKSKPKCDVIVTGKVIDSLSQKPIANATIEIKDEFEDSIQSTTTDKEGKYAASLPCSKKFTLIASKTNYSTDTEEITTTETDKDTIPGIDFELTNYEDLIKKDERDNQEKIVVNPIYFDFDKADITPQAATELDKVVFAMEKFPNIKIKIESHTDSRGSDSYNLKLSQARADSTKEYIIENGIDANRIESAIGYGETRLINHCSNGVKCTDEEHELNRRSEFIVIQK